MTKYVITDPCYIIADDKWDEICSSTLLPDKPYDECLPAFNAAIEAELSRMTDGAITVSAETGFGDWTNRIDQCNTRATIINENFCADAGMVSLCALTPAVEEALGKYQGSHFAAVFETDCELTVEIEDEGEYKDWTLLNVYEKGTYKLLVATQAPYSDEEDEYEDEDDDFDDEDYNDEGE